MAFNVHDLGDLVRVSAVFYGDPDTETQADPDVVKLSVLAPDDTITTYVYGEDAEIIKDDTGEYHADLDANQAGSWYYRWWSTGTGQAAEENMFQVRRALAVEEE